MRRARERHGSDDGDSATDRLRLHLRARRAGAASGTVRRPPHQRRSLPLPGAAVRAPPGCCSSRLSSPSRPPWLPRGPRVLLPGQVKLLTPSLPCIRIPVQFFLYSNAPSTRTNSRPSCICASQCNQTVCCGCRDAEARPPPLFTWFSSSQLLNAFSEISLYIGVSLGGSNIV
jgi:hypothetical protein